MGDIGRQTRVHRLKRSRLAASLLLACWIAVIAPAQGAESPRFGRDVVALFSKLGCNGGTCHGAVQGKNGFRLSLFGADPQADFDQLTYGGGGRRVNPLEPEKSLFLLKATHQVPHEGGRLIKVGSWEHDLLRRWIVAGLPREERGHERVQRLRVTPVEQVVKLGETFPLRVEATFADESVEDVTRFCAFTSGDPALVSVDRGGLVKAVGVGDTSLIVRYRGEPAAVTVLVPRATGTPFPVVKPHNFVDEHILAKLQRLNVPPAPLADDETFLRRASLDITGALPSAEEVRAFVKETASDKRSRKIDELLERPGHAALWTLKFCDLLKATDFGVYADGLKNEDDAPRFQAWVRARLQENTPYDQLVARILLATSREGKSVAEWGKTVEKLYELSTAEWGETQFYSQRQTLDLYWQRKGANGLSGTLQIAHSFLGLRLECAQCHRHPHDVWQQDDLLSFANFFMRVRTPGFQGENEKKYVEHAPLFKAYGEESKKLEAEAKSLKEGQLKELANRLKQAEANRKQAPAEYEKIKAEHDSLSERVREIERRSRYLKEEVPKRILHADIHHQAQSTAFAKVTSPLGTQESRQYRLLGESEPVSVAPEEDPRQHVVAWLRRPDNPYFAKAIVNRVWAHYFGRGIVDPPDNLSPLNLPTHPRLLDELSRQFIAQGYNLRWLHRTLANSRTYQQSTTPAANVVDRTNYASFYFRRLPAELLVDAVDQVTGTREEMGMKFYRWPAAVKAVESPFVPQNAYVVFMLEQFGKPKRNAAVQCDCERDANASVLQVMSLANHPRILQKIADSAGRAASIAKQLSDDNARIEELFLTVLSRFPTEAERGVCLQYLKSAESADKGMQGLLWSLLNTREFLLQH